MDFSNKRNERINPNIKLIEETLNKPECFEKLSNYLKNPKFLGILERLGIEANLEDIKEEAVTVKEDESKIEVEEEKSSKEEHKPANIENYIKEMEEKLKEREKEKEAVRASIDPNATIEEIEEDYSAIAELLGDEEIVIGGHSAIFSHSQNPKYIAYFFQCAYFFEQKVFEFQIY